MGFGLLGGCGGKGLVWWLGGICDLRLCLDQLVIHLCILGNAGALGFCVWAGRLEWLGLWDGWGGCGSRHICCLVVGNGLVCHNGWLGTFCER